MKKLTSEPVDPKRFVVGEKVQVEYFVDEWTDAIITDIRTLICYRENLVMVRCYVLIVEEYAWFEQGIVRR